MLQQVPLRVVAEGALDLVMGLPAHPLMVHFAVVLLPLAAAGLIAIVLLPRLRAPLGWVVMLGLLAGVGTSVLAKESGEAFAARVGWPTQHARLGDVLPLIAFALLIVGFGWFWLQRRDRAAQRDRTTTMTRLVAAVACVLAVAAIVLTAVVGHTGAVAVWEGRINPSSAPGTPAAQAPPAMSGSTSVVTGSTAANGSAANGSGSNATATLTMDDVAQHASSGDCWSVVNGTVYDLTSWISQHPGGSGSIESMCGIDATDAFGAQHSGQRTPEKVLAGFEVGPLTG